MAKARHKRPRRPIAQSAATRPAAVPSPRIPRLPHNPGTIIGQVPKSSVDNTSGLTPPEHELLMQAGWAEGDPIPDLTGTAAGQRLAAEAADVAAKANDLAHEPPPVDPTTPPITMPEPRQIEDLPPAEQQDAARIFQEMEEIRSALVTARQQKQDQAEMKPSPAIAVIPGMPEAYKVAAAADKADKHPKEESPKPSVELVDDLDIFDPMTAKPSPAPEADPEAAPTPEPVLASQENSSQEQTSVAGSDISDSSVFCPHCGCDLNVDPVVITSEDKVIYLACIMGEHQRFEKEIALFGDRIYITFRTLLPRESDLAILQVDKDLAEGKIYNQLHYIRMTEIYRMLAGIAMMRRTGQQLQTFQPVHNIAYNEDKYSTPFVELKDFFDNSVFLMDSFRKTVEVQWTLFSNLIRALEARADDADFFKGIA